MPEKDDDMLNRVVAVEKKQIELDGRQDKLESKFDITIKTLTDAVLELKELNQQAITLSQENKMLLSKEVHEREKCFNEVKTESKLDNMEQDLQRKEEELKNIQNGFWSKFVKNIEDKAITILGTALFIGLGYMAYTALQTFAK